MKRGRHISPPIALVIWFTVLLCCLNITSISGQKSSDSDFYLQDDRSTDLMTDKEWEEWQKKREDSKYWENIQKAKQEQTKEEKEEPEALDSGLIKAFATFLLVLIGIIVAFFVVRQLMGVQLRPRNRKIKRQGDLTIDLKEIEDKLEEVVLDDFIQDAIKKGNFALAIRLYYLEALKTLAQQKQISWKKDKTNRDYLEEMKSSRFHHPFRDITRLFERVWYGNRSIDATVFQKIAPTFQQFIAAVKAQDLTTTPS